MHELSLCESLMDIVRREAAMHQAQRVRTVWVDVGALSCVSPEALTFCFAAVARGTLAEGAELIIVPRSAQAWCVVCEATVDITQRSALCPQCGGEVVAVNGGDQLRLSELEIE